MAETSIKISLELADKAAQKALSDFISKSDQADKNLNKLGEHGKDTFSEIALHIGKATGVYDIFAGNLAANLAVKGLETLTEGAHLLFETFIGEGVKAAKENEEATNALNIALANTGIYSEATSESILHLAEEIQGTTGISKNAITTNAALIQSLGQLDENGLKKATTAAVDLSAALGKDLGTVSEALAKAAAGNTTALGKMGIAFQEGATHGETFNNILKSIEDRFGGSAEAKVHTYAGAVQLAKTSFEELQEEIGNSIVKNNVVISVLNEVSKVFLEFRDGIKGNTSEFKEFVANGVIYTIDALMALASVSDSVGRVLVTAFGSVKTTFDGLGAAIANTLALVGAESKETADAFTQVFLNSSKTVQDAFSGNTALGKVTETMARLREAALKGFDDLKAGASTAVEPVNNLAGGVSQFTEELSKSDEQLKSWAENLAKATTEGQAQLDAQIESLKAQKEAALIVNNDYLNQNAATELQFLEAKRAAEEQYFIDQQTRLALALDKDLITETQYQAARKTMVDKAHANEKKAETELTKFKNEQEKQRAENMKSTLGYISSLQQSGIRELFFVGKAAALAVAYIDAQAAVVKALASAPPPINFVLAGLVGTAAAINISKIASASPPAFEDGGIVPGTSFSGDKVAARVNSGEMILNRSQQTELFKIANGGGSGNGLESKLDALIGLIAGKDERVIVNIGGKTIVDSLRSELNSGRSFA